MSGLSGFLDSKRWRHVRSKMAAAIANRVFLCSVAAPAAARRTRSRGLTGRPYSRFFPRGPFFIGRFGPFKVSTSPALIPASARSFHPTFLSFSARTFSASEFFAMIEFTKPPCVGRQIVSSDQGHGLWRGSAGPFPPDPGCWPIRTPRT